MPSDLPSQYDASPKEMRMIAERGKIRAAFRQEFLKQAYNPHVHGHGGYLFDPAMQRWISMRSQHFYYFKPCRKSLAWTLGIFFTCIGYGHLIKMRRDARDRDYRAGLVAYKDRRFKMV